jgi:tetratricopeptide (TPR) repeat protein
MLARQAHVAALKDPAQEWADLVRRGYAAAEKKDWDAAAKHLRRALDGAGDQAAGDLRKNLAVVLANRAAKTAEDALRPQDSSAALARIEPSAGETCVLCGKPAAYRPASSGESGMAVCEMHAETFLAAAGQPTAAQRRDALQQARNDLEEARRLAPRNAEIRKSLRNLARAQRKAKRRGRSSKAGDGLAEGLLFLAKVALVIGAVAFVIALIGGLIPPWEREAGLYLRWGQAALGLMWAWLLWANAGLVGIVRAVLVAVAIGLVAAAIGAFIGPWAREAGFLLRWGQASFSVLTVWVFYKVVT